VKLFFARLLSERVPERNRLGPSRPDRDHDDLAAHQLFEPLDIIFCIFRQCVKTLYLADIRLPAGHLFVHRFAFCKNIKRRRNLIYDFTLILVTRTDSYRIEIIKNIELGDSDTGQTVHPYSIAEHDSIKPAAAARSAGGRAEFVTSLTHLFSGFLKEFCRERSAADTRNVSF